MAAKALFGTISYYKSYCFQLVYGNDLHTSKMFIFKPKGAVHSYNVSKMYTLVDYEQVN